jgi:hypothetical protein
LRITEHGRRFVRTREFHERIAGIIAAQEGTIKFEQNLLQMITLATSIALCIDEHNKVTTTDEDMCDMTHNPEVHDVVIAEALPAAMALLGNFIWDSELAELAERLGIKGDREIEKLLCAGLIRRVESEGRRGFLVLHQGD